MLNNGLSAVYLNNTKDFSSTIFSSPTKHRGFAIAQFRFNLSDA